MYKELSQWQFFPLIPHLPTQLQTGITWGSDLNKINLLMVTGTNTKSDPHHDLPQTCARRKSVCLFWIQPTYKLQ